MIAKASTPVRVAWRPSSFDWASSRSRANLVPAFDLASSPIWRCELASILSVKGRWLRRVSASDFPAELMNPAEAPRSFCNSWTRLEIIGAACATTTMLSAPPNSASFSSRSFPAKMVNAKSGSKQAIATRVEIPRLSRRNISCSSNSGILAGILVRRPRRGSDLGAFADRYGQDVGQVDQRDHAALDGREPGQEIDARGLSDARHRLHLGRVAADDVEHPIGQEADMVSADLHHDYDVERRSFRHALAEAAA